METLTNDKVGPSLFDIRAFNIAVELWTVAFCAMCIVCCLFLVRPKGHLRGLIVAGLALELVAAGSDAAALAFRGVPGRLAWFATRAGSALSFVACFLLLATLTSYLCLRIADAGGRPCRGWQVSVWCAAAALSMLAFCGVIFHVDGANAYHRSAGYWLVPAYVVATNGTNAFLAMRARHELGTTSLACLLFYCLAPLVAAMAQALVFGADLVVVASVFGFVVIFLEMQSYTAGALQKRTEDLARVESEAAQARVAVMVSQIQPHFVFNALDTIYGLIDEDAGLAKESVVAFSNYLRTNLESLRRTSPVPVERELGHVRTYLELERLADEERVSYEVDAQAGGFSVPALSVQTLAENAVKHGIGALERGGHIWVRTREHASEFTVSVVDDGVGFDPSELPADGSHVGIANTRGRVEALCGGTLEVLSEPGRGTTAIIHVPKRLEGGR